MEGGSRFLIQGWKLQRLLIPANRNFWHSLIQKTLRQPRVGLHDLRERVTVFYGLANFLQLTDSFVKQSHLAECDPKVVVRLRILVCTRSTFFEFLLQLPEHIGEINSCRGIEPLRGRGLNDWLAQARRVDTCGRSSYPAGCRSGRRSASYWHFAVGTGCALWSTCGGLWQEIAPQ